MINYGNVHTYVLYPDVSLAIHMYVLYSVSKEWLSIPHIMLATWQKPVMLENQFTYVAYRKWRKIRWAKLSQIPKFFMGKLLQCLKFKTLKQHHHMKLVYNISIDIYVKTFSVLLKTTKIRTAERIFTVYSLHCNYTDIGNVQ